METTRPILFHNTMRIADGSLAPFQHAIREAVAFAQEHGPQLMVEVFIDEQGMRAHSYQLYVDSDAIRRHWEIADPYIDAVMQHCTVERFEVYGQPDEAIMSALQAFAESGVPMDVTPPFVGFTRLAADE